jgi:hypothetical protein
MLIMEEKINYGINLAKDGQLALRSLSFEHLKNSGTTISHYRSNETFVEGQFIVSAQSPTFEYGIYSNECSEGLGFDHFYVQYPCNFPIEDYTEIFCTIYKWNISSI